MFTLDGALVSAGQYTVAPGEGHVLLRRRPAPPPALIRKFAPGLDPFDLGLDPLWRRSALREESGASYLHLDKTPAGEESEHDLALDLVRYLAPRGQVTLWYRTSDPAARVEIVVEVDDRDDRDPVVRFALVDGSLKIGSEKPRRQAQFRAVAPAISQFALLRVIDGGAPMIADEKWHILVMDLDAACAASGRYTFRRALFARLLGTMDNRQLRLADRGLFRDRGKARRGGRSHARLNLKRSEPADGYYLPANTPSAVPKAWGKEKGGRNHSINSGASHAYHHETTQAEQDRTSRRRSTPESRKEDRPW